MRTLLRANNLSTDCEDSEYCDKNCACSENDIYIPTEYNNGMFILFTLNSEYAFTCLETLMTIVSHFKHGCGTCFSRNFEEITIDVLKKDSKSIFIANSIQEPRIDDFLEYLEKYDIKATIKEVEKVKLKYLDNYSIGKDIEGKHILYEIIFEKPLKELFKANNHKAIRNALILLRGASDSGYKKTKEELLRDYLI